MKHRNRMLFKFNLASISQGNRDKLPQSLNTHTALQSNSLHDKHLYQEDKAPGWGLPTSWCWYPAVPHSNCVSD